MEKIQVSINGEMDNGNVVHIYCGILLTQQKKEILPFATTWNEREGIMTG